MILDLIRTDRDYKKALARIDALTPGEREVVEGSPQARELDVLSVLVHHWEREHVVMNRKRPLSITMIRNLVALGMPPASLIGEIRLRPYPKGSGEGASVAKEKAARYRRRRSRR